MTKTTLWTAGLTAAVLLALLVGCGGAREETGEETHDDHGTHEEAPGAHEEAHDEHGQDEHGHDEHGDHAGEDGVLELSPEAVARIGLTTAEASLQELAGQRTTTGKVGFDEDRLAHVAPRVAGRLVRVPATLGEEVDAGEVLAVVDSLELGEAKATYLRARARQEVAQQRFAREQTLRVDRIASEQEVLEAEAAARESAADLAAARETLRLLGLAESEIGELAWDAPRASQVAVRAPFGGTVIEREATLGELASPERALFTVADLSRVWVWLDLYEHDLAQVEVGERVEVRLDAWPEEVLTGRIGYLAAELDAASRTLRARVDLPNPEKRLKPGMFARVTLTALADAAPAPRLVIPRAAVQRHGDEAIVFVRTAPARFERREVELGQVAGELVEVVAGLAPGASVVIEGAFLLKSQASADEIGGHHH